MQYVCRIVFALLMFLPGTVFGAANFSIIGYQYQGETRITRTQYDVTYTATLLNTGPSVNGVTAVLSSLVPSVQIVPGKNVIHFGPAATNAQVQSMDSFTIRVDRSVAFDFSNLVWSFANPVANAGANQTGVVGATIVLNGSGSSNPSGVGTLTYSWSFVSVPPGSLASLTGANTIAPSFVIDAQGSYVIKLVLSNGVGTDSATVTVSTINSPPVANAGSNQTVQVGSTVHLNGSNSSDVDGDPLTYLWSFKSTPANSAAVIFGAQSVMASFVADLPGTYVVQLVVNDGKVSSPASLVTITTANSPPVANAGPNQVVAIGAFVQLNGSGSTDVNGDPLTYKWSLITLPLNSKAVLNNANIVNPTFTADLPGTYVVQLIVNDGQVDSAPATVTISTNAVQAPMAQAGPNQTVVHGTTVTLKGSGTDPQSLPLTLSWSLITLPQGSKAQLSPMPATIASPTFVADLPGVYVAQLIVNNGSLSSSPATVTITTTNTPPVAKAGPNQEVTVGAGVTLDGSGSSDADNDPLTFKWSLTTIPASSTAILSGANTKAPTFTADLAGTYVAQLIVNDGFVDSVPATVTITANVATITLTPNPLNLTTAPAGLTVTLSYPAGNSGQVVNFTGFDSTVISMQASATVPANSTGVNVQVTPLAPGNTTVTASGGVFQPGSAMVVVAQPPVSIVIPATLTLAPGDTVPFPVTLAAPPQGPVTVTLMDSDTSKATLSSNSISFNAGQTTPTRQPTITGVANGPTTITATAPGLTTATSQVTVALTAVLSPANLTVLGTTGDGTLTLTLSGPAPSAITFTLKSSMTGIATVPPSLPVSQGTQVVSFKVTGVSPGTTVVTASAPGFADTTSNVTVASPGNITLSTPSTSLQLGQTATLTVALSQPAPSGGVAVTLTNDAKITLSPQTVNIAQGATSGTAQITAVNVGASSIGASAPGFSAPSPLVLQIGATIAWVNPTATIGANGQTIMVDLRLFATVPGGSNFSILDGLVINTSSSNTNVATVPANVSFFWDGSNVPTLRVAVTSVGPGTTTLHASGTNIADVTMTVTVNGPLTITTTALTNATVGTQYNFPVVASGGNPPETWSATGLPANLSINSTTGVISGIPVAQAVGPNSVTITVTDSSGRASSTFTLTVNASAPASIAVVSGSGQSAQINQAFANPMKVVVKDGGGNLLSGVTVTFTAPGSGASGTFAGGVITAVTDASGTATSAVFTANGTKGSYSVTASVSGLAATATFTLTNTSGAPASITVSGGSGQSAQINQAFASQLSVVVKDAGSNVLSGVTVTFTAPGSGASGTFAGGVITAVTDASGTATSAVFTANGTKGSYSVTASVSGLAATATFTLTNTSGAPASITVSGGSGQSAQINQAFASQLSVVVKDAGSNVLSGVTVTFTAPGSGASGTFAGGVITAVTDASGTATSAVFTANGTKGSYSVTATVGALSATFTLTNTAGAPAAIAVNGGNLQGTPILTAFASPLKVLVSDSASNPVSGVTVTFTVVPVSGAGATFASNVNTAVTNASGIAQSAVLTANAVANTYTVTATVNGTSITTSFTLTNQPGPAAAISAVSGSGQSAGTNTAFANPLVAKVTDQGGNVIRGASVTFTAPASGPGGTFAGNQTTVVITDSSGLATSVQFTANGAAGTYAVTAAVIGVTGTASFTLTNTTVTGGGQISVNNATVGQNLQTSLIITLNPPAPSPSGVTLTITSTSPSLALVGGGISAGKPQIQPILAAGTTTVSTIVQALASSGTVTITLSAPGYADAHATITLAPAGFILQGPDGTSNPISTFEGIATPLTVAPVYLNPDGSAGGIQQIAGGFSVNVTVTTDAASIGTTSPGSVGFSSGTSSAGFNFVASKTNTGIVDVLITAPPGFTNPTAGAQITFTVQVSDIIAFSATIGAGLETNVSASLSGPVGAPTAFTFHSNDPSKLLFASSPTATGTQDLVVTIVTGQNHTPDVYAQAVGGAGTSPSYQLSAAGFSPANGTISIVAPGLLIQSPGGFGAASFSEPLAAGAATITVFVGSAPGGVFSAAQLVIGGGSVSVTVSSNTPSVGTIGPPTITIPGGSGSGSTLFQPQGPGTAGITASATGFGSAFVSATVTGSSLIVDSGFLIGFSFEQMATVTIPAPAGSGGATVTIQSNSPSLLLAVNATDPGASQITVQIAQNSRVGTFFIYAGANSGSGTYTATFPGVSPVTGTAQFTNSGFVLVDLNPTTIDHTQQTSKQLVIFAAILDSSGNPLGFVTQPLAGNQQLRISVQSSSGAATVPATVSLQPGLDHVFVPVTIVGAGTPTISVSQPGGYTTPTVNTFVTLNIT